PAWSSATPPTRPTACTRPYAGWPPSSRP
ncbi:MAG: hypothetical protein AVDCRST_MAG41-4169, partial [uncultured Corynebacteriales bacterium]